MAVARVKGKRSPRWAFMQRMTIPCHEGTDYLVRLRIVQTSFISIVLRGRYTERVYHDPVGHPEHFVEYLRGTLSVHGMGRSSAHRINYASPRLKTLIITGPRKASWGFFVDGSLVDWRDYELA